VMELDWQHLQEEIQALGRQEYRELVSRLRCITRSSLEVGVSTRTTLSQLVFNNSRTASRYP
ncbi:DUF29 domain-containing protein, partial [Nostoc sp. HG1]|nr:DUF29 domain-containing protein [Nostoc sp. HG1]